LNAASQTETSRDPARAWPDPDMSVLQGGRREPQPLPLVAF
jgi:hypothetical protein